MSTASAASPASTSKKPMIMALAVIGVVVLIVGILWFAGAAPGFLNVGSHVKHGSHVFRGAVAAVIGLALLAFAFIQNRKAA